MATPRLQPGHRVTFAVSDVAPAAKPLPEVAYHEAVAGFLGGAVESCSTRPEAMTPR